MVQALISVVANSFDTEEIAEFLFLLPCWWTEDSAIPNFKCVSD
jgi:hypothetical protein